MSRKFVKLIDDQDPTPLVRGGLPGSRGKPLKYYCDAVKFKDGQIRPETELKVTAVKFKSKSPAWRILIVDESKKPITFLSPIGTLHGGVMYTGRGNLDVPIKPPYNPKDMSEANWWFELSTFPYASAVKDPHERNKHVVDFIAWVERVCKWLFFEALLNEEFAAPWKDKILKRNPVGKVSKWTLSDLDVFYQDECRLFTERKDQTSLNYVNRLIMTSHCMYERKTPGMTLPYDAAKPKAISDLESEFRDKENRPTHFYNAIPIYAQRAVGKWELLSWADRDAIPGDLAQACEFQFSLSDSGKGYAKGHSELKTVFLVGTSPHAPPLFSRVSQFGVSLADEAARKIADAIKAAEEKERLEEEAAEENKKRVRIEESPSSSNGAPPVTFTIPPVYDEEEIVMDE